jgi:hypothetical protein
MKADKKRSIWSKLMEFDSDALFAVTLPTFDLFDKPGVVS